MKNEDIANESEKFEKRLLMSILVEVKVRKEMLMRLIEKHEKNIYKRTTLLHILNEQFYFWLLCFSPLSNLILSISTTVT